MEIPFFPVTGLGITAVKNQSNQTGQLYLNDTLIGLFGQLLAKVWGVLLKDSIFPRLSDVIAPYMCSDEPQAVFPVLSKHSEGFYPLWQKITLINVKSPLEKVERVNEFFILPASCGEWRAAPPCIYF